MEDLKVRTGNEYKNQEHTNCHLPSAQIQDVLMEVTVIDGSDL